MLTFPSCLLTLAALNLDTHFVLKTTLFAGLFRCALDCLSFATTRLVTRPAEVSVAKQLIMALTSVAFLSRTTFSQFFIFSRSGNKVFLSLRFATRVHRFAVLPQLSQAEKNQEKKEIKENP